MTIFLLHSLGNSLLFTPHYRLLTRSQTANFRLFQTQRIWRRQFQVWWKRQKVLQMDRKQWEKEKLLVTSNFSFSCIVFKRLVMKTRLFGKGLTTLRRKHSGKRRKCLSMKGIFHIFSKIKFVICKCFKIGLIWDPGFYVSALQVFWQHCKLEVLERLYRSIGLMFLLRWREDFNLYLRNTAMKFGKSPVNSFSGEVFLKEKVNKCTHTCTWLSLYKSIINRIIKEICIHIFNLPKFWCSNSMHFSYENTQSTKGK